MPTLKRQMITLISYPSLITSGISVTSNRIDSLVWNKKWLPHLISSFFQSILHSYSDLKYKFEHANPLIKILQWILTAYRLNPNFLFRHKRLFLIPPFCQPHVLPLLLSPPQWPPHTQFPPHSLKHTPQYSVLQPYWTTFSSQTSQTFALGWTCSLLWLKNHPIHYQSLTNCCAFLGFSLDIISDWAWILVLQWTK